MNTALLLLLSFYRNRSILINFSYIESKERNRFYMFYSQKKIHCIDKENEEVIVSFKGYDLIFEIIGYKGGFRISYDRETDTIDRNVENIFLCEKSKNKNYTIKSPLDFVKEEVFTFKDISSITLSLENFYIVTIYEVWEEDIAFDVKVKINFKTG